ncbi:MAG: type II/IV secretion system protein [Planctomycetes bacterium]|nr:type II/IV secretion system protein [Planctomycetota bacterium]
MGVVGLEQRTLAETLRQASLVEEEELERGLKAPPLSPTERLDDRLVRLGIVDDLVLYRALAAQNGLAFVSLVPGLGDPALSGLLDKDWARSHGVLPLYRVHGELTVAIADPTDVFTRDALRRLTGLKLRFVVAHPEEIGRGTSAAQAARPGFSVDDIIEDVGDQDIKVVEEAIDDLEDAEKAAGLNPVVRLVNFIIAKAIREKASDIHVEPGEDMLRVRFRVDGMLRDALRPPARMASAIVSRVKIMSSLDIAERRAPQDGRMQVMLDNRSVDLRVSTLPTFHGEKLVVRILDRGAMMGDLSALGLTPRILEGMQDLVNRPNGVMLVTGPTGSGKTTTLYGCLATINSIDINICTVENPTEYSLPMVNQVQVNERAGLTFATALRSLLRQDPDVIMVGEIRDRETAQICIEAALTGHQVFSTLHTNDAISAITRLVNMGIESYLLAAAMNGVLAQRLVRRICKSCKVQVEPDARTRALCEAYGIKLESLARGEGCAHCGQTGYSGRAGLYELFVIDDKLRDIITAEPGLAPLRKEARNQGHLDLAYDGLCKVAEGLTSVEEVTRVAEINFR